MKVLTVTNQLSRCKHLADSLTTFGWDFEIIECEWHGLGTKMLGIYHYLLDHPEVKDFIFTDSFDSLALREPDSFRPIAPNFVSAETNYYSGQDDEYKKDLFKSDTDFKYPNSGGFYMQSDFFIKMYEENPFDLAINDQGWMIDMVIKYNIPLDTKCEVFQTLYQVRPNYFIVSSGVMTNVKTLTQPIFFHGNGGVDMDYYNNLFVKGEKRIREKPSVFIATPTTGSVHHSTMQCIFNAAKYLQDWGYRVDMMTMSNCYLHESRNILVSEAIKNKSDYIMFIDADMYFFPHSILQLIKTGKDVVGGHYYKRKMLRESTVVKNDGRALVPYKPNGLERVWAIPTG